MDVKTYFPPKYEDNRGYLYSLDSDIYNGIQWAEDRISVSKKGVIRGFHGDEKTWKLMTVFYGKLLLTLHNLETKQTTQYLLTDENRLVVLVPPKYLNAHQVLSDKCVFFYKWSEKYAGPDVQYTYSYKDPGIMQNFEWEPIQVILSDRDIGAKNLYE